MEMDILVFSRQGSGAKELGAVQERGNIAPLSAWTTDHAYANSIEFVVAEEDMVPGLEISDIIIHSVLPESLIGYGSRQVGGGKGPGNPHGEESEITYYVDQSALEDVTITINPELEITW